MKRYLITALFAAAIAIAGCAKESSLPNPTGEATLRAINAIPASPDISFLIEERLIESVAFKTTSSSSTWDDLDYTFNFQVLLAGDTVATRVASQFIDVVADTDYTMLISGALEAPDITVWETAFREWTGDETAYEIRFANGSPSIGEIDVYLLDPETLPAGGTEIGTVSLAEITPAQDFESAEKIIVFTPAGDDSTILYQSQPITPLAASSYIVAVFDGDENDTTPYAVRLINTQTNTTGSLVDANAGSQARFFHGSINAGDADIYLDDPLTVPVVAGHTFRDVTGFIDLPSTGALPLTYTAAGNIGAIIVEADPFFAAGARYNLYLSRSQEGEDVAAAVFLDRRSVSTRARISITHLAADHPVVDIYIVPAGELIDERIPTLPSLQPQSTPFFFPLSPDDYDVYLTVEDEKTVLTGPEPLTLQLGDVVEAVIYDTVDPNIPAWVIAPPP
jgi:hypothetical protein